MAVADEEIVRRNRQSEGNDDTHPRRERGKQGYARGEVEQPARRQCSDQLHQENESG